MLSSSYGSTVWSYSSFSPVTSSTYVYRAVRIGVELGDRLGGGLHGHAVRLLVVGRLHAVRARRLRRRPCGEVLEQVRLPPGAHGGRRSCRAVARTSDRRRTRASVAAPPSAANVGARSTLPTMWLRFTFFGHARTAHDERHVHVLLVRGLLALRQSVVAEVEAIVRREDDVGVGELPVLLERRDQLAESAVDRLQRLDPLAIALVDLRFLRRREERLRLEPRRLVAHVRLVVVRRPRRDRTGEGVDVLRRRRRGTVRRVHPEVREERLVRPARRGSRSPASSSGTPSSRSPWPCCRTTRASRSR